MQALDRREPILGDDAPRLAAEVVTARPADIEMPGRDAAARAGLHEDFDDQAEAFAGQRALQRCAIALLDDDARDALRHHRVEKFERLIAIGGRRQQVDPSLPIHRRDGGLDGLEEIRIEILRRRARAVPGPRMRAGGEGRGKAVVQALQATRMSGIRGTGVIRLRCDGPQPLIRLRRDDCYASRLRTRTVRSSARR